MKSNLVICLGNRLAGDDGIGWHVARQITGHPDLPDNTEVICAGADLLRHSADLENRTRVVVVDAALDGLEPGTVTVLEDQLDGWEERQTSAHHLSPVQAIRLLRDTVPGFATARLTLIAVSIADVSAGVVLSGPISAELPNIVSRVIAELAN